MNDLQAVEQPRRFNLPDIDRHGAWLLPRLIRAYPHLNDRQALGWLRSILNSNNEFLFLFLSHGVALAQLCHVTLSPRAVVRQHFVWVQNVEDPRQLEEAAEFYVEMARWARRMAVDTIVDLEANTDVPLTLIKAKLGRVLTREQLFAKVTAKEGVEAAAKPLVSAA